MRYIVKTCIYSFSVLISPFVFAQEEHKILSLDGAGMDKFGRSVAVWDTIVLAGAVGDDDNGANSGSAYLFSYDGSALHQLAKITADDGSAYDNYGISVAVYDTIAMVGANLDDPKGNNSGAVYVYHYNGSNWVQVQKLSPMDGAAEDEFGFSIALWKNLAVIGAYKDDVGYPQSGSVYIYRYNGTQWIEENKLNAFDYDVDDFFGYDVDIYDSLIVVGAYLDDDNGTNSGSAYIFHYSGFGWQFDQKIIASDGAVGDAFGFSVAIDDTMIAVGAYAHNATHQADGMTYIYRYAGGSWTETDQITAFDAADDDWFGYSVDLSQGTLIAGAFHDDDLGSESGAVYVFRYDGSTWIQELKLLASDGESGDQLGSAVAISGFHLAASAPFDDDNGTDAGAVYVYPLCTYTPVQQICAVTVDTSSSFVEVVWDKPLTTFIDSFLIYRDTGNAFGRIVAMDYGMAPYYADTAVHPNNQYYRYVMATANICGVEGPKSDTNQTIHLSASPGSGNSIDLAWTPYLYPTPTYYRIWRDTAGNGAYDLIHATQNFEFTWTDPDAPSSQPLKYIIEAEYAFNCPNGLDSAISNAVDPFVTGIKGNRPQKHIALYPNPVSRYLYFSGNITRMKRFEIYDLTGNLLAVFDMRFSRPLDLSFLSGGAYLYRIVLKDHSVMGGVLLHE